MAARVKVPNYQNIKIPSPDGTHWGRNWQASEEESSVPSLEWTQNWHRALQVRKCSS